MTTKKSWSDLTDLERREAIALIKGWKVIWKHDDEGKVWETPDGKHIHSKYLPAWNQIYKSI